MLILEFKLFKQLGLGNSLSCFNLAHEIKYIELRESFEQ